MEMDWLANVLWIDYDKILLKILFCCILFNG